MINKGYFRNFGRHSPKFKKLDTLIQKQQQLIGKASSNFSGWSKLDYR